MFKRLLLTLLMFALVFGIADARKRKSNKSGEVENGVYTDATYGFTIKIPDNWNTSTKKGDDKERLVLTQKQYEIPMAYTDDPNYTQIPKITVYVDTVDMRLDWFVDSLLAPDKLYKSDQKNDIYDICEILHNDFTPKMHAKRTVGIYDGVLITGEQKYTKQIPDVYTNYYGGAIFFTEKNGEMVLFHLICENLYFHSIFPEFLKVIEGFRYPGDENAGEGK